MELITVGALIRLRRRAARMALEELAARAAVGRSTVAALEAGTLRELGFGKVLRICEAVGLVIDVREPLLDAPILDHRHLTELAGRELTKAAMDDIILRGDVEAWRRLIQAARDDRSGRTARRLREVAKAAAELDVKGKAFAALLPRLVTAGQGAARRRDGPAARRTRGSP